MKKSLLLKTVFTLALYGVTGCKVDVRDSRDSYTAPSPVPTPAPVVTLNTIEFRALGNPTSVRLRFLDPVDGLTQVQTTLPYSISIKTDQTTMFLSLEATPTSYPTGTLLPFLSIQIFVNSNLFREASSTDLSLGTIAVNGTWRK